MGDVVAIRIGDVEVLRSPEVPLFLADRVSALRKRIARLPAAQRQTALDALDEILTAVTCALCERPLGRDAQETTTGDIVHLGCALKRSVQTTRRKA